MRMTAGDAIGGQISARAWRERPARAARPDFGNGHVVVNIASDLDRSSYRFV